MLAHNIYMYVHFLFHDYERRRDKQSLPRKLVRCIIYMTFAGLTIDVRCFG